MKLILTIIAALLLAACAHTQPDLGLAPAARMPELPQTLAQPAHRLPPITDPSLGGVNESGAQADAAYNDLSVKFNALLNIYNCTKQALDKQNAKAMQQCIK